MIAIYKCGCCFIDEDEHARHDHENCQHPWCPDYEWDEE